MELLLIQASTVERTLRKEIGPCVISFFSSLPRDRVPKVRPEAWEWIGPLGWSCVRGKCTSSRNRSFSRYDGFCRQLEAMIGLLIVQPAPPNAVVLVLYTRFFKRPTGFLEDFLQEHKFVSRRELK